MKANYIAINQAFGTNHVALTQDQALAGMHAFLLLMQVSNPTTSATQIALFNKLVSGVPNLFYQGNSDATPIQMTYPSIKVDSSATQYSFVAGPFIIYGGYLNNVTQNQVVTLNPGTTLLYVDLIATNIRNGLGNVNSQLVPTLLNTPGNSFTIRFQANTFSQYDAYYFGIGV
jgi:hypothetical protein